MFSMHLSWFVSSFVLLAAVIEPASADSLVTAVLPSSRSAVEGHLVTVFSTVINSSGEALHNCSITHTGDNFSNTLIDFALTDPSTNQIVGSKNAAFSIAAGASQSMVLEITSEEVNAGQLRPVVGCSGAVKTYSSTAIDGLNTILFSSGLQATPDVIALVASPSADGVLRIQGNGANAFAVAVSNVGSAGTITAKVDDGNIQLPLTTSICQTNSAGQCLQTPASTTSLSLSANATASFAVFVQAAGPIPFYPAGARIFVRFSDSSGNVRGATSVAVTNAPALDATIPKGGIYVPILPAPAGAPTGFTDQGVMYLSEDGELETLDQFGAVLSGTLSIDRNLAQTGTVLYQYLNQNWSYTWQGAVGQRGWFSAELTTPPDGVAPPVPRTFLMAGTYERNAYESGSSLQTVAGNWKVRDGSNNLIGTASVSTSGSYSGTSGGCAFTGQISLMDTRYNLYRTSFNLTNCTQANSTTKNFTGLAGVVSERAVNDTFFFIGHDSSAKAGTILNLTRQ